MKAETNPAWQLSFFPSFFQFLTEKSTRLAYKTLRGGLLLSSECNSVYKYAMQCMQWPLVSYTPYQLQRECTVTVTRDAAMQTEEEPVQVGPLDQVETVSIQL